MDRLFRLVICVLSVEYWVCRCVCIWLMWVCSVFVDLLFVFMCDCRLVVCVVIVLFMFSVCVVKVMNCWVKLLLVLLVLFRFMNIDLRFVGLVRVLLSFVLFICSELLVCGLSLMLVSWFIVELFSVVVLLIRLCRL